MTGPDVCGALQKVEGARSHHGAAHVGAPHCQQRGHGGGAATVSHQHQLLDLVTPSNGGHGGIQSAELLFLTTLAMVTGRAVHPWAAHPDPGHAGGVGFLLGQLQLRRLAVVAVGYRLFAHQTVSVELDDCNAGAIHMLAGEIADAFAAQRMFYPYGACFVTAGPAFRRCPVDQ